VEEFANSWLFFSSIDIFFGSAVTVHCGRVYKDDGSGFLLLYQYIFSLNSLFPYTVEKFAKTTATVFFFFISMFFG
jgi:hypothetical protein